jgi:FKBP-type peptidyl-prolyl cis-trans isomerase 2
MHTAQIGDRVRIQYSRLPQRAAAPGVSRGQKTLEFTVGSNDVSPALRLAVVGMAPGDRRQITLQPQEAFGTVKRKLIRQIPRERFPENIALKVGKRLTARVAASGCRERVRIVKVNSKSVTLDRNHPLAGKVVTMEVSLLSLDSSSNANKQKPQFDVGGQG